MSNGAHPTASSPCVPRAFSGLSAYPRSRQLPSAPVAPTVAVIKCGVALVDDLPLGDLRGVVAQAVDVPAVAPRLNLALVAPMRTVARDGDFATVLALVPVGLDAVAHHQPSSSSRGWDGSKYPAGWMEGQSSPKSPPLCPSASHTWQ